MSLFAGAAHADLTVGVYQELLKWSPAERAIVENYVHGVAKGYLGANTSLAQNGQALLFCFNGDLALDQANNIARNAVAQALRKGSKATDMPVELLLLFQLVADDSARIAPMSNSI